MLTSNNIYFEFVIIAIFNTMPNSIELQFEIEHVINEIIENWCHEKHRITIESFKSKTDYLIWFWVGNWDKDKYFFKTAISVKGNNDRSFEQLLLLVSLFKKFCTMHMKR